MAKITLEEYNKFLEDFENQLKESIHLTEGTGGKPNKGIDAARSSVETYMRGLANDGTGRFQRSASEVGLNPTGYEKGKNEYSKMYDKAFNAEMEKGLSQKYDPATNSVTMTTNPEMSQEILDAAEKIRQYINQNKYGGTINWEQFKKDPDYVYLMRMKDLMDRKGLSSLYDDNAGKPSGDYGITKGDTKNFDYTSVNDSGEYESVIKFWTSRVRNFVESKFGLDVSIPKEAFPSGNKKLPNNTLIVNFSSAIRCPAWNECVVKHACYARGDEKPHTSVFRANTNRYLLWELTRGDDKMLSLMMNMVKAYMFNYELIYNSASGILRKNGIKNINDFINLDLDNELIETNLFELFDKYKAVTNVRLNENGDFLGQWLVDAWNNFGGQVKKFGITISAYTCRNLNYEGVKNIVLNSSNLANKNVDRYFIAISEEAYESFDDTHDGFDPQTGRLKTVLKPLGTFDEEGNWTPNGNMYYKCPCGNVNIMGPEKKRAEKTTLMDYDCYKCNTCYTPNDLNGGKPYYVFVKLHHQTEAYFQERDGGSFRFGFSENYLQNKERYNASIGKTNMPDIPKRSKKQKSLTEITQPNGDELSQSDAIKQVANNMITSMNNHFSSYNPTMEEERVKSDFNQLLERINNTDI